MKNTLLPLLALYLLIGQIQAQIFTEITPSRESSLGNHGHSSRDEIIQLSKDVSGNCLLLGFLEGDSIFADVSLQKISPGGDLLWDYRFDSKNSNNYDVPLKMVVDSVGNTTVLGLSYGTKSFFSPQLSNGYLFKISAGGELLWQVGFDTLLVPHASGLNCDGFMDAFGNFYVSYSLFNEFIERPTHFMKFSPQGVLLQSFTKYDIAQKFGGGPAATSQAIDLAGNFVFLQWDDNNQRVSIRKVDPETANETITVVNTGALSTTEKNNYTYLARTKIWLNESGELYTANNLAAPFPSAFVMAKVDTNGFVQYVIRPDSLNMHFASMEVSNEYAYVSGSYTPKGATNTVAFLWKINAQGHREYEITASAAHDCVTRFLTLDHGNLYWATQDAYSGQAILRLLETSQMELQWEYPMHQDPAYIFTGVGITTLPGNLVTFAGTLRKEKQPGSSYLSEEDFYVETFAPFQNELYGQYRMSGIGTTIVENIGFSVDRYGNKLVKTRELDGPEYPPIQSAPRKFYYHKFAPDWTTDLDA